MMESKKEELTEAIQGHGDAIQEAARLIAEALAGIGWELNRIADLIRDRS